MDLPIHVRNGFGFRVEAQIFHVPFRSPQDAEKIAREGIRVQSAVIEKIVNQVLANVGSRLRCRAVIMDTEMIGKHDHLVVWTEVR
jgi:hypothetical protein